MYKLNLISHPEQFRTQVIKILRQFYVDIEQDLQEVELILRKVAGGQYLKLDGSTPESIVLLQDLFADLSVWGCNITMEVDGMLPPFKILDYVEILSGEYKGEEGIVIDLRGCQYTVALLPKDEEPFIYWGTPDEFKLLEKN